MWILGELSIASANLKSFELRIWILWKLSIVNVHFIRAKNCECKFYVYRKFASEFLSAKHCKKAFYKKATQRECALELSIANANFMRADDCQYKFMSAEHCECEFNECWESFIWTLWELLVHFNFMRAENCECE